MAEDLVLDTAIRDWVLVPLSVVMVLIGVLRYFVAKLMRSYQAPDLKVLKEGQMLLRARNLKAGANFIPAKSFRARRVYFTNEENGLLHVPKEQAQNAQAQMFSDPNMAMDMMKKNLSMIIPQTLTFAWVNFFFSGFVAGKVENCKDFFRNLYMFIYILGTYLKPHVAILDGITMGGGAGVSVPGTFRIATDKTIFATPETHIGFHPDAGASFYLSHLTGHVGEYLALTGERLNGVDMLAVGLATHYSMSARLNWIDERLAKLATDDPSVIDSSLAQYGDVVYPDKKSIFHRLEVIDRCFGHETVEEIVHALESEAARSNQDWCTSALKKLKEASPLSLKVTLRSIREGRFQTLDECLVREYRMSLHGISKQVSHDFCEGVRARLVDKDLAPKWDPPSLEQVSDDMVGYYFSPLGEFEPELKLPTHLREAFI